MKEAVFVSAFFDIGRGNKNKNTIPRSTEQYFDYFANWCRIQNYLIVFTEPQFVNKVYEIRQKYHLKDKTKVIGINNIYDIEPEIYERMLQIENNEFFKNNRLFSNAMSNKANYDYVMLLKYWCLKEAKSFFNDTDLFVWMDFGFDHGGKRFLNHQEYNLLWSPNIPVEKITLFSLYNPKKVGNLEMLQLQTDCIMGCFLLVPSILSDDLWKWMKEAMSALLMLECIDDDQMLLLMAAKKYSYYFKIVQSNWFLPFALYGNGKFTISETKKITLFTKIKGELRRIVKREKKVTASNLGKRINKRLGMIRKYEEEFENKNKGV